MKIIINNYNLIYIPGIKKLHTYYIKVMTKNQINKKKKLM